MCASDGSSTIGARVPSKSSPTTVSAATRTSAAYRCSPTSAVNSMTEPHHTRAGERRHASVERAGEDDGEAVQPHGVHGGCGAFDAEVEGQQPAGLLQP